MMMMVMVIVMFMMIHDSDDGKYGDGDADDDDGDASFKRIHSFANILSVDLTSSDTFSSSSSALTAARIFFSFFLSFVMIFRSI